MNKELQAKLLTVRAEIALARYHQSMSEARDLEALSETFRVQAKMLEGAGQETPQLMAIQAQEQVASKRATESSAKAKRYLGEADSMSEAALGILN